jgi:hypothetical protein
MAILIVTYDLKSPQNYTPLYEALKAQGVWWHYLASTWLIDTAKSPQEVFDAVHPHIGPHDFILISELGQRNQGWLPQAAWDWINSRVQKQTSLPFGSPLSGLTPLPELKKL